MFRFARYVVVLFCFLAVVATPAAALTESEIEELQKQITVTQKEIAYFKQENQQAKGEGRILSAMQFLKREKNLREALDQLANHVISNQEGAAASKALSAYVLTHLNKQSTVIKEEIQLIEKYINRSQAKHEEATSTLDKMTTNQNIEKGARLLNEHMEALFQNSMHLEALNVNADNDLAYLDKLLKTYTVKAVGQLELTAAEVDSVSALLSFAPEDIKKDLTAKAAILNHKKANTAENLSQLLALMELRSLDTSSFQHVMISATGQVSGDIFNSTVAIDLFQRATESVENWLFENGVELVWKIVLIVLIIIAFTALSRFVGKVVSSALNKSNLRLSGLLKEFFTSIASKLVLLIGILVAMSQFGIQVTPLLAGLGMVGFIVGFALQDTLSNFASGLMILIYRPFDEGDLVEAAGVSGTVSKLSLVSTTILTLDNQSLVVPNSKIWGDVIRNVTAQTQRRVDMVFSIGYSDDIPKAEEVLMDILSNHKSVLKAPQPMVKLHTLNDSSVDFVVRPWVKTEDYWNVYWDVTRTVKQRFDQEDISIPFPQRDVHIYKTES